MKSVARQGTLLRSWPRQYDMPQPALLPMCLALAAATVLMTH